MKKLIAIALSLVLALGLVACGGAAFFALWAERRNQPWN